MFQHHSLINPEQNASSIKLANSISAIANSNRPARFDSETTDILARKIAAILQAELGQEMREKQFNAAIAPPASQEVSLQSEENFVTVMELLCRVA